MFKKPRLWIVIACGAFIVAGAIGVFAFSDKAEAGSLLAASAVVLLLGTTAFLVLTLWALAREGVTPLTEKQLEKARVTGEVLGHISFTVIVWGFGASGLAKLIGLGGATFWIVTASGIVVGLLLGVRRVRHLLRGGRQASDTTGAQPPAGNGETGGPPRPWWVWHEWLRLINGW
jgi:hypothetical protein